MAALLEDEEESVAAKAASYFARWPDRKFADPLLQVFQSSKGALMDYCAQALARLGDNRFIPIFLQRYAAKSFRLLDHIGILDAMMEVKRPEGIEIIHLLLEKACQEEKNKEAQEKLERLVPLWASTLLRCHKPEEITYLLKYYLASPRREDWGYLILAAFVAHANAPYSREELEQETKRRALSRIEKGEIAQLANGGAEACAETVEKLLKKKSYVETIDFLSQAAEALFEQAKKSIGELAMREWEKRESQLLINLRLLRALAGELPQIKQTESTVQRRLAITALLIYSQLWQCREFIGASLESLTAEKKLALLLEEREELQEDDRLIGFLAEEDSPTWMTQACLKEIKEDSHSIAASRAIRLLGRLGAIQAIPTLLSLFRDEDDGISDLAHEALSQIGEPVLPFIANIFQEGTEREINALLPLLGRLPYPATVDLILSRFDHLYEIDRESLVYALEELGSSRFIPLLKACLKEDEPEEEVFSLLCRVHGIEDPELPRIERTLARRDKESKERMARLLAGDKRALVRENIPLPLRCVECSRTYTYSVSEVLVDQDDKEMREIYIRDPIICKHCRAEGKYEITPEARLAVTLNLMAMVELDEAGKAALNEGPVKVASLRVAGRPMGPKQGLAYYQEQIAKHPDRADLRVGYGNLLLFWKKEAEARAEFEKAVQLDPLAVEALSSLAQMEMKAGRLDEAYSFYRKCLEVCESGHFFHMEEEKRDLFREQLEMALWDLQEELHIKPPQPLSMETGRPQLIKKEKVGRNDPCPCGSGKKYKRCCLAKEEFKARPSLPTTMVTEEEDRLTKRLVSFAASSRFKREFAEALSFFFSKPVSELADVPHDDSDFTQFIEWFIHDYQLAGGSTVIEEFARTQGTSIPPNEREILQGWLDPAISLFEVQESSPERAEIRIKDLFTGKEILIRDVSGSKQLVKWDLIATRVLPAGEHMRPSGSFFHFRPRERDSLIRFLNEKWGEHRKTTGKDRWEAFMKAKGYLFYHYALSREAEPQPPLLTPEYHDLVFCKALYDVDNFHAALYRLRQEADFHLEQGEEEGGEKKIRFAWLKRGKSKDIVPEGSKKGQGLVIQSALLSTPASRGTLSLGTLNLTERRLTLETLSRERLEAGKRRIEISVGSYLRFRADSFESAKAALERHKVAEEKEKESLAIPLEEKEAILKQFLTRHLEDWLHTPIPALDGKSPLDTVRLPGGKERVEQLLKEMENMEERKRREGEIYADVGVLREKLGLPLGKTYE